MSAFAEELDKKLDDAAKRRGDYRRQLRDKMVAQSDGSRKFANLAGHIMDTIVRPRMDDLAERFDHARVAEDIDTAHPYHCTSRFGRTDRYPATAQIELGIGHDEAIENVALYYSVSIIPVYLDFEKKDEIRFSIDTLNESWLVAWVEEKLLRFLDTYLRLEQVEQYQRDNLVIDPVCGMTVNKAMSAAFAEYQGQAYYFCVQGCRDRFVADPAGFLNDINPSS
ncbi:MAG: hypothetical protein CMJ19_06155 [Phycisphaeraceae bacterium]|nr:hypothetical protein [Phycisphaeraceae bacterium]